MAPRMHYVEHLEAHGEARFAMVCELDLEGIVAKQADSPYRAGRSNQWLKVKNQNYSRQEAIRFPDRSLNPNRL
jgi:bifunctional non-homologous end joining protein LigD